MQVIQKIREDGYPKIIDYSRIKKPVFKVDIRDANFDKPLKQLNIEY